MLTFHMVRNNGFSKLVIQPKITDGYEKETVEIQIAEDKADELEILQDISKERE